MTLRRTIADRLRAIARTEAVASVVNSTDAVILMLRTEPPAASIEALRESAIRHARIASIVRFFADLFDPGERAADRDVDAVAPAAHDGDGHAEAGAARGAPLDGAGGERLRGAAVAAGEDSRVGGGHGHDATTSPLRFVKGGRA